MHSYLDIVLFVDEMRSVIRVLVQFNYDKKAKELQHTYDSFLSLIGKSHTNNA